MYSVHGKNDARAIVC